MRYKDKRKLMQQIELDTQSWKKFEKFNMAEFINQTLPIFMIWSCTLNHVDCRTSWKLIPTHLGLCLQLDIESVKRKPSEGSVVPTRVTKRPTYWRFLVDQHKKCRFDLFFCSPILFSNFLIKF